MAEYLLYNSIMDSKAHLAKLLINTNKFTIFARAF